MQKTMRIGLALILSSVMVSLACAQSLKMDTVDFPVQQLTAPTGMTVAIEGTEFDGINDAGTIAGSVLFGYRNPACPSCPFFNPTISRSFVYSGGKFTLIDDALFSHGSTRAIAIDNHGDVLVSLSARRYGPYYLIDTRSGTFRPVGVDGMLEGYAVQLTAITGMNDKGEIAGYRDSAYGVRGVPGIGAVGALSAPVGAGKFTRVGCAGVNIFRTGGINNNGDVAGSCGQGHTVFLQKADGTVQKVETPVTPGQMTFFNNAISINDAGEVVGFNAVNSTPGGFVMKDGQFLIQKGSFSAWGIGNHGQIVGFVQRGGRYFTAFIGQLQP